MKKEIDENLIAKALEMHEMGKTKQEITSRLVPNGNTQELEEILDCLAWVETEGKSISPSPLLLRTILGHVPHIEKKQEKEASSAPIPAAKPKEMVKDSAQNASTAKNSASMNKKLFFPIGAFALVLFLFFFFRGGSTPISTSPSTDVTSSRSSALSTNPVTVDDIFVGLDNETDNELTNVTAALDSTNEQISPDQLLDTTPIATNNEI
ncbi:MAG: hypothetical protein PHV42_01570 [Candidatus Pacebacteria bacterium]|nr:hypothetical protein [Candidatus Paceibacterota bacterium]